MYRTKVRGYSRCGDFLVQDFRVTRQLNTSWQSGEHLLVKRLEKDRGDIEHRCYDAGAPTGKYTEGKV